MLVPAAEISYGSRKLIMVAVRVPISIFVDDKIE